MKTTTNPAASGPSRDAIATALAHLASEFAFTIVDACGDSACAVCVDRRLPAAA